MKVRIHPSGPLGGYVAAPPSKNYTLRLLLGAVLADGETHLRRPATNDDARALVACCRALGARIEEAEGTLVIRGVAGQPRNPGRLNPGNAGAVLRFLLGTACLIEGEVEFVTDHPESLGRRPNEELLDALRQLGAEASGSGTNGMLPITICGGRSKVRGGRVVVSGANSSQFLSSLLYLTPYLEGDSEIFVRDTPDAETPGVLVSRPLIDQTLESMGQFRLSTQVDWAAMRFMVPGGQMGTGGPLMVNADWPSSAALMSIVAVAGGMAKLYGLLKDAQGERRARNCLEAMGCKFPAGESDEELVVHSKGELRGTVFNGDLATDAVLALVAAACFAEGTTRFEGVHNLRLKECNRIEEPLEELAKLGVVGRSGPDWMEIDGNPDGYAGGIEVDSRGDHRVAQLLSIVGTRCTEGLTILRAEHISKSYPDYFEDIQRLGVKLEILENS